MKLKEHEIELERQVASSKVLPWSGDGEFGAAFREKATELFHGLGFGTSSSDKRFWALSSPGDLKRWLEEDARTAHLGDLTDRFPDAIEFLCWPRYKRERMVKDQCRSTKMPHLHRLSERLDDVGVGYYRAAVQLLMEDPTIDVGEYVFEKHLGKGTFGTAFQVYKNNAPAIKYALKLSALTNEVKAELKLGALSTKIFFDEVKLMKEMSTFNSDYVVHLHKYVE